MDTSSFHKFPELPTEIRLQIWETACSQVVTDYYYRGLQSVDIYCRQAIVPTQISLETKNRSAYMLDSGLWKACKESKEVVAKHTYIEGNITIREHTFEELAPNPWGSEKSGRPGEKYTADWIRPPQAEVIEYPVLIRSGEDEECFTFVHPYVDVFCIQVDNWLALQHDAGPWPSIERTVSHRPPTRNPPNTVTKIALLYNHSWATDLPSSLYNLAREDFARGYLAYLIQQRMALGLCSGCKELYLIDKESKWFWKPPLWCKRQVLYWDCDAEYVKIEWSQVVPQCNESDAVNAAGFIHKLGILVSRMRDDTYAYGPRVPHRWIWLNGNPLINTIKLLVRRDNQVRCTTMDCQPTCHETGGAFAAKRRGLPWNLPGTTIPCWMSKICLDEINSCEGLYATNNAGPSLGKRYLELRLREATNSMNYKHDTLLLPSLSIDCSQFAQDDPDSHTPT